MKFRMETVRARNGLKHLPCMEIRSGLRATGRIGLPRNQLKACVFGTSIPQPTGYGKASSGPPVE